VEDSVFAIAYPILKIIIKILIIKRIQAAQTIIQTIFLRASILTRSMNMVNIARNPRGSIILSGKIVLVNTDWKTLNIPKPI
jgi:hypothetical protein